MIYGVEAQDPAAGTTTTPSLPTYADAVHFTGADGSNAQCALRLPALPAVTDTGILSWAGWFFIDDWDQGDTSSSTSGTPWMIDPQSYDTYFQNDRSGSSWNATYEDADSDNTIHTNCSAVADGTPQSLSSRNGVWVHIMAAASFDVSTGLQVAFYINDVSAAFVSDFSGITGGGVFTMAGTPFYLGDDGYGASFFGSMFDFSFWPNVNFLSGSPPDIQKATRRLFINELGEPVPPQIAIAALGSPALMLTGGLQGFKDNTLGTAGALAVATVNHAGSFAAYDSPVEVAGLNYGDPNAVGGYVPQPVRFTGKTGTNTKCGIKLTALSCTNNGNLSWAGWFRNPNWYDDGATNSNQFPFAFMIDAAGVAGTYFRRHAVAASTLWEAQLKDATHTYGNGIDLDEVNYTDQTWPFVTARDVWVHFMCSIETNHAAGTKKSVLIMNGYNLSASQYSDVGVAYSPLLNGKDFWLGDDGTGKGFYCDVADFSLWPGVTFMSGSTIPTATRQLFVDDNLDPVDPSVAIGALGTPAVMCAGGVTGFLANALGGSGTLSVQGGYDSPVNVTWA